MQRTGFFAFPEPAQTMQTKGFHAFISLMNQCHEKSEFQVHIECLGCPLAQQGKARSKEQGLHCSHFHAVVCLAAACPNS